jgi:hypothetical protein
MNGGVCLKCPAQQRRTYEDSCMPLPEVGVASTVAVLRPHHGVNVLHTAVPLLLKALGQALADLHH